MTEQGQVTVPDEVRRLLGLHGSDRIAFVVEEGTVRISRAPSRLEDVFGSVPPITRPEDFDALKRNAIEDKIERDRDALR